MLLFYCLEGHTPVPCTMEEWVGERSTGQDWQVARDIVGGMEVSTVFLGIDHGVAMGRGSIPILFETALFHPEGVEITRYATWDEALLGHRELVEAIKESDAT